MKYEALVTEFLMRTIDGGGLASWEYTHHVLLITCQQGRAEVDLDTHTHTLSQQTWSD